MTPFLTRKILKVHINYIINFQSTVVLRRSQLPKSPIYSSTEEREENSHKLELQGKTAPAIMYWSRVQGYGREQILG